MMRESYGRRSQDPPLLESVEIVAALILMVVCWFAWYVARGRFYLKTVKLPSWPATSLSPLWPSSDPPFS